MTNGRGWEDWDCCSLFSFSSFLVPLKGNELMFVGSAATCCGALFRIRMGFSLVRPQRNSQKDREDDAHCQVKNNYIISCNDSNTKIRGL